MNLNLEERQIDAKKSSRCGDINRDLLETSPLLNTDRPEYMVKSVVAVEEEGKNDKLPELRLPKY